MAVPEPIEVEVLEIDGAPPPPRDEGPRPDDGLPLWQKVWRWLSALDRRWWPLWVLLGIVLVGFVIVAAVILAAFWVVFAALRSVLRFLTGFGGDPPDTGLRQTRN